MNALLLPFTVDGLIWAASMVGRTGFEPMTSSVPGKDDIQVIVMSNALASGFILHWPPAHPTKTTTRGARVAHDRGVLSMTYADGYHDGQFPGKPLLQRDPAGSAMTGT
jgi:hypothetical protein